MQEQYVVDHAPFMVAMVSGGTYQVLRSRIVQDTDALYQKWAQYLGSTCFRQDAREEFESEDWMFGGGWYKHGVIFEECPGQSVTHNCKSERATSTINIPTQGRYDGATEGSTQVS